MDNDSLRDLIMERSPVGFWKQLATRQDALYSEARSHSFDDALWQKPEAETIYPIVRRALFESEFRKAATENGLQYCDCKHAGDNYPYVLVTADKLIITAHHVAGPNHFVRAAESRKQNAAVNGWLDEYSDERLLREPLPTLSKSGNVNLYVLHGQSMEMRAEQELFTNFLQIAIPDSEISQYRRIYRLNDILQLYAQRQAREDVKVTIADRAMPRLKKDSRS